MSEQSGQYLPLSENTKDVANSIAALKCECHHFIELVARRPRAIKLLMGVRNQLQVFSQYKANRSPRLDRPPNHSVSTHDRPP